MADSTQVQTAANVEAAEQWYLKGRQSAEAGDLSKAVRFLERARKLHPGQTVYVEAHSRMERQLEAVRREQQLDADERAHERSARAQGAASTPEVGDASGGGSESRSGPDMSWDNVDSGDADEGKASTWEQLKGTLQGLARRASRVAIRASDAALSLLERDPDRNDRLRYIFYYWYLRLFVPLCLGAVGVALRLCFMFPWAVFYLLCLGLVPLGWFVGEGISLKRKVTVTVLGLHLAFAYALPYSAAYLYGSIMVLGLLALFRLFAAVVIALLVALYWVPWLLLYCLLFAIWSVFAWASPIPVLPISLVGILLWFFPWTTLVVCGLGASGFVISFSPVASLPIGVAWAVIYFLPRTCAIVAGLGAFVMAVQRRRVLLGIVIGVWEAFFGAPAEEPIPKPRPTNGQLAVSHVLQSPTHYEVLAISMRASSVEIKSAYKRMALLLHPDKNPDPNAQRAFERLTQAMDCVSNPFMRAAYDISILFPPKDDSDEEEEEAEPEQHRGRPEPHRGPHGRHAKGAHNHHRSHRSSEDNPHRNAANSGHASGGPSAGTQGGGARRRKGGKRH
mmetsp:Transcript_3749/g.11121  ORF Transcript_3749/g.11121 Transcript_3749/m.11121 type:complete len:564 (+) Transcript_3749:20-1711(+)